ncbi:MAG: hypothetical protein HOM96_05775 [Rickettsiales bacterium]|jgi:hypothetical protein|nr:hypothetical protein [Rickettsiales bacterium]
MFIIKIIVISILSFTTVFADDNVKNDEDIMQKDNVIIAPVNPAVNDNVVDKLRQNRTTYDRRDFRRDEYNNKSRPNSLVRDRNNTYQDKSYRRRFRY